MSEENKQKSQPGSKGGAHVAKAGSNIASSEVESKVEGENLTVPKRNKYADKMNKKKSRFSKGVRIGIGIAVVVLLLAAGIFLVWKTRNTGKEMQAETTAEATRGMLETYIEGSGVTAAKKREELGRDLKGRVTEVLVEVGDEVKKGDKLIVVNPTETRQELETAQNELAEAQRSVTAAQAEVTQAQNTLNTAQKKLGKLNVTAPFTGKIIPVSDSEGNTTTYRVGQQISEGEVIGHMVDDSKMTLSLYFSSSYINDIQSGQSATVSIPSAMSEVPGTVSSVEKSEKISADGVKMFRVVISMQNPGTLTKGMVATATISAGSAGEVYPAESGTLEYSREEAVTAQVGGEISVVNGIDYYSYSSGATIMRLTSDSAQDEVKNAQNGVTTAKNGVTTAQKLVQDKQDRITELKKLIDNATIESPIDGVVVSVNAVADQDVSGADALIVVADLKDIVVNADILSTDVGAVQPGQSATMSMYTYDDSQLTLTGIVDSVALEPNQDSSGGGQGSMPTFRAVIAIDPIEGQSIYSGMMVDFKITTASSMDCLMVPSRAIVNTESGSAVFAKPLTDENGKEIPFSETLPIPEGTEGIPEGFVLVPVEVGIADSTNTEILWGIDEGTTVFLAGPQDMYASMDMESGGVGIAVG
ncbi:HlyD family efflux transporter periplasmic adaptor subunit [Candidatus Agathobaculum pullicola]|uniref:efflux RND transporter periplasmic adaptor subunit n=1 Tax=Candidatus Agathobaculum pullicola TaxID=2838426 RepID=UPI003F93D88C